MNSVNINRWILFNQGYNQISLLPSEAIKLHNFIFEEKKSLRNKIESETIFMCFSTSIAKSLYLSLNAIW